MSPRTDLILTLVRASIVGDRATARAAVEAMITEERQKKKASNLVERLTRILQAEAGQATKVSQGASQAGGEFVAETTPRRKLSELILSPAVLRDVRNLIEEQCGADLLRSHGIQPRHRILLAGPPGNGKTALAEVIAEALAIPFFVVRYETLIGSYLGETTQRLKRLFDFVKKTPCVLLFDEFDAIGKERGDVHETGEIKRVVSSLLLQIDALPSYVVVIAATNHSELLDRAVWRRFQLRLSMPQPTAQQLTAFFAKSLEAFQRFEKLSPAAIAEELGPLSFAEATDFILDLRRREVLAGGKKSLEEIAGEQLLLWAERGKLSGDGKRSNKADPKVRSSARGKAGKGAGTKTSLPTKLRKRSPKRSTGSKIHGTP